MLWCRPRYSKLIERLFADYRRALAFQLSGMSNVCNGCKAAMVRSRGGWQVRLLPQPHGFPKTANPTDDNAEDADGWQMEVS